MDSLPPLIDPILAAQAAELSKELALFCVKVADDHKAMNIKLYDVSKTSMLADYYMICSGNSEPHLRAIINYLEKDVKEKFDITSKGHTRDVATKWMILDYPNVLIHVFHPQARDYYRIEELWKDGKLLYPAEVAID